MHFRIASFITIFSLSAITAQDTNIFINRNAPPPPAVAPETNPIPAIIESPAPSSEPIFGLDLMLGMMTGIRAEGALWNSPAGSLRVEGFYGALFTKFGSSEAAGAGLRWQTRRCSEDGCRAVVFGPGCDVLFHFGDGHAIMIAPTVELAWHRTIRDSAGWILGINAGVGIGVSGQDTDGDSVAGKVTPLISGFTGFRY